MSFVRFTPIARFYRNVLRSVHACCLPPVRQTGRLAGCSVPIPPWVVIAISAFSSVVRLSGFMSSLLACAFSCGDPDGGRRDEGTERRGERSRRQGVRALFVITLALICFPRGVRWGSAPQTAPKSLRLSGLSSFGSRRGCASRGEGVLGYNEDLAEFNLCSGKSCGHTNAPMRSVT